MPCMESCCCWRSLRRASMAIAVYSMVYYCVSIATMSHFVDEEQKFLSGQTSEPTSESYLEPTKVSMTTVVSNITLLVCSSTGVLTCFLMFYGLLKDIKKLLLPWLIVMIIETLMDVGNMIYLVYEQQMSFNPITSILFTMDTFVVILNVYCMSCVYSQYQEYQAGRGTAAFDEVDRLPAVHYTAAVQPMTTSSMPSGRRRSTFRPTPSRIDVEEASEVPRPPIVSVLSKPNKPSVKKHVQFPDDQASLENATPPLYTPPVLVEEEDEDDAEEDPQETRISSLWMEIEHELPSHSAATTPER